MLLSMSALAHAADPSLVYAEQYRPQIHFSPPAHWMNDPNGLVLFRGEYHLFYQHNPGSSRWGPMHWGHAVSRDSVHWKNLPIALYPDDHGAIFSGSVVADVKNTSGFGTKRNPPLVAMFTYHDHQREALKLPGYESQALAFSLDAGRHWTKYPGNPVLEDPAAFDFRDPHLSWHAPSSRWIAALAAKDHVAFYSSADLKHWTHESDFGRTSGSHAGVWECPGLMQVRIEGGGQRKAVLLVSVGSGGPNGGSATQYFVGEFDGHRFTLDASQSESGAAGTRWLDYGTDNYAAAVWSGMPDRNAAPRIIGWMSNWQYANDVPTETWRSAMTLPRDVTIVETAPGFALRTMPVRELHALRSDHVRLGKRSVNSPLELAGGLHQQTGQLEVDIDLDLRDARLMTLTFENARGESASLRLDRLERTAELDRRKSGNTGFHPEFAKSQWAPIKDASARMRLLIYLDRSSIEIFIGGGETVLTSLVFPTVPFDRVRLEADATIQMHAGDVYALASTWR